MRNDVQILQVRVQLPWPWIIPAALVTLLGVGVLATIYLGPVAATLLLLTLIGGVFVTAYRLADRVEIRLGGSKADNLPKDSLAALLGNPAVCDALASRPHPQRVKGGLLEHVLEVRASGDRRAAEDLYSQIKRDLNL